MIGFDTICREFKPGVRFYEDVYGTLYEFCVIDWPQESYDQVSWKAINYDGATTNFLITKGFEHRGPKLYWEGP